MTTLSKRVFTESMATCNSTVPWGGVRRAGSKLTTPLHPDDYLRLLNPLWTSRELRGRVEQVVPETDDAATLVIRPGWGWRWDHRPGQYIGIGIPVDGRYQWRSYSVSSPMRQRGRTLAITVRAMPEGKLSSHLVNGLEPGTIVRLAAPEGDFTLPDPPPARMLFLVGGSGITPVMSMLRTLDRRGAFGEGGPDVVLHYSSPTPERMIFRDELLRLEEQHAGLRLHQLHTDTDGMLDLADLDAICPDWRERETWACGPAPMLDAIVEHYDRAGLEDRLHVERFSLELGGDGGEGGTLTSGTPASGSRSTVRRPSSRPARRPGSECRTAAAWASATPARSPWSRARSATSATATSSVSPTSRSRPASPPPSVTARSTSKEGRKTWPSPT